MGEAIFWTFFGFISLAALCAAGFVIAHAYTQFEDWLVKRWERRHARRECERLMEEWNESTKAARRAAAQQSRIEAERRQNLPN